MSQVNQAYSDRLGSIKEFIFKVCLKELRSSALLDLFDSYVKSSGMILKDEQIGINGRR